MQKRIENIWPYLVLTAIMLGAAFFRFYAIKAQGFLRWDEAHYFFTAYFLQDMSEYAKPLHSLFARLGIEFFGATDYGGKMVSAAFGIGTVLVIYLIGKRLYDQRTGLISGALLAFSYNHIYFSRLGHAQADSVFFLALAVLYYCSFRFSDRKSGWRMAVSGLSLAASFMCHPNIAPFVLFFAVLESGISAWNAFSDKSFKKLFPAVFFGGAMAGAVLAMELSSRVIASSSYLLQIFTHANESGQGSFGDYLYYLKQMSTWDGSLRLIITIFSLCFFAVLGIFKKLEKKDIFLLAFTVFSVIFWTVESKTADNDRIYTSMQLGFSLLISRSILTFVHLPGLFPFKRPGYNWMAKKAVAAVFLGLCAWMFWQNLYKGYEFINSSSYYKSFTRQISMTLPGPVFMPDIANPIVRFYLLTEGKLIVSNSVDEAATLYREGRARYFMIPLYPYVKQRESDTYYQGLRNQSLELQKRLSLNNKIRPFFSFGEPGSYDYYLVYDLIPVLH